MTIDELVVDMKKKTDALELLIASNLKSHYSALAYGQVYRSAAQNGVANVMTDVLFTGGNNDLFNITHSTGTNPAQVGIVNAGVYLIQYRAIYTPVGIQVCGFQLVKNAGAVVLPGSYVEVLQRTAGDPIDACGFAIASLAAGDYVKLQMNNNANGQCIAAAWFRGTGAAESAAMTIVRLA